LKPKKDAKKTESVWILSRREIEKKRSVFWLILTSTNYSTRQVDSEMRSLSKKEVGVTIERETRPAKRRRNLSKGVPHPEAEKTLVTDKCKLRTTIQKILVVHTLTKWRLIAAT